MKLVRLSLYDGMQVKNNLHMVFTARPVGANFRIRSQRFLATINSTVIDWFQPGPEASLHRSAAAPLLACIKTYFKQTLA